MLGDLFPIDWKEFHFLRPMFLWGFAPVLLILVTGLLSIRQEVTWKEMIAPHLQPFVIQKGNERVKVWMQLIGFFALSFGVLGLAGPTWKKVEEPGQKLETPFVVILDLSQSMLATDLQPNRLERAKFKISDLIAQNPQARMALIGFAGTAHTIVPLTKDYAIIKSHINGLSPDVMPFPGSNLGEALTLADTLMSVTDAPGTVLILSDDIENAEFDLIRDFVQNSQNRVELLPINTLTGAEIPNINGRGVMKDESGKIVVSALNEAILTQLNALERVSVNSLTLDTSDVELISNAVKKNLIFTDKPEEKKDDWRDAGLLFIIPMAVLLLLWFRKGWVVYGLVLMVFTSCSNVHTFEDLWYTKDYQGQKLSDKGDFEAAAERFEDPLRKGVAYYKAGNYEAAIQQFRIDTSAYGAYNLGLAYLKNGDIEAARWAFGEAVEMDSTMAEAAESQKEMDKISSGQDELDLEDAKEAEDDGQEEKQGDDIKNSGEEGQEEQTVGSKEPTEEDMEAEDIEQSENSNATMARELEEVPEDTNPAVQKDNSKMLMRKVDDDPSLFLKRKFAYQVKKDSIKPKAHERNW